jgi:hypothetical protein
MRRFRALPRLSGVYQTLKILLFPTSSDPALSALIRGKVFLSAASFPITVIRVHQW